MWTNTCDICEEEFPSKELERVVTVRPTLEDPGDWHYICEQCGDMAVEAMVDRMERD